MQRAKRKIITGFLLLLISLNGWAQSPDKANRLFEKGQYEEALSQYEVLLKRSPSNLLYTYRKARCLQEVGQYTEALPLFAKTEKKYPLTYFFMGECYQALWMPEDAIASYQLYQQKATSHERDTYIEQQIAQAEQRIRYLRRVADIQIIDSIVVHKDNLLQAYPLSAESGQLMRGENGSIIYLNGRGDRRFFAHQDENISLLQQQFKLLDNWEQTETLPSAVNRSNRQDYPFCLSDGVTFYFASQSADGMGGWDIYVTRFNPSTNSFTAAENIGYPFNSEANDYLYVIDEQARVGYFATDRNCSQDSVCVYTFLAEDQPAYIPVSTRHDSLIAYARLQTYHRAERPVIEETSTDQVQEEETIFFVISDNVIYTSLQDFRSEEAKHTYFQWDEWQKELTAMNIELNELRQAYNEASPQLRSTMTSTILAVEKRQIELQRKIEKAAQKIRRLER